MVFDVMCFGCFHCFRANPAASAYGCRVDEDFNTTFTCLHQLGISLGSNCQTHVKYGMTSKLTTKSCYKKTNMHLTSVLGQTDVKLMSNLLDWFVMGVRRAQCQKEPNNR